MNQVNLMGRLGSDPESRYTTSGTAVANVNMATNEVWRDKDGNKQEATEWHKLVFWNKPAETVTEYAKKGDQLLVTGQLKTRQWDDQSGVTHYTTEVHVRAFEFVGGRSS